jgi:hypothetical protein
VNQVPELGEDDEILSLQQVIQQKHNEFLSIGSCLAVVIVVQSVPAICRGDYIFMTLLTVLMILLLLFKPLTQLTSTTHCPVLEHTQNSLRMKHFRNSPRQH